MENRQVQKTLDQVIQGIDELLDAVPRSLGSFQVEVDETAIPHKYVLIGLGTLKIALPMDGLVEVGPLPAITPLPNLPEWIPGIVNLRSEILSVIDLAGFLELPAARALKGERFVVVRNGEVRAGLPIDRIYGIAGKSLSERNIALPVEVAGGSRRFFAQEGFVVDDQVYCILEVQQLLSSGRFLNYRQAR